MNHPAILKQTLNKVPEITFIFWITKILTTGMGEVFSDYLFFNNLSHSAAILLSFTGLATALILQLSVKRYIAWVYWLTVVAVSIFGTMFADFIHDGLKLPFLYSTTLFVMFQAAVFTIWYIMERTLSISSINTRRREAFYWATVLGTFTLGTATGDLTAVTMDLGTFTSGILFTVFIAIPALLYKFCNVNKIFSFWFAYIMTRPLGASFSDWMAQPQRHGGLGWGTGTVSLALSIVILILVGYMTMDSIKKANKETQHLDILDSRRLITRSVDARQA